MSKKKQNKKNSQNQNVQNTQARANETDKELKTFSTYPLSDDDDIDFASGVQLPRPCQVAAAKHWVDANEK